MKVSKFVQGFLTIIVFCVSAAALHAQDYKLFVMGGGSSLFDKNYYSIFSTPYGSTFKTGWSGTVGAEIPLSKIFGVEGSYGLVRNNLAITNFASKPATETGYDIRDQRLSGDLVAHSPKTFLGVRPYLVGGIEYDRFAPVGNASAMAWSQGFSGSPNAVLSADNKLGFNYGGGLEAKLTNRIALRADVRDHVTASPTFGLPPHSTVAAYYPISGAAHGLEYSAGVVFNFRK